MEKGHLMELNFEGLERQKPTGTQRVDERNTVICLFIMLTSRVAVFEMSKMTHFLYFLLMTEKN